MGRADPEPGKPVERSLEDQVRERNRRVERIADDVAQAPAASQPLLESCGSPLRMDENQAAELFRLRPERMEPRVGQLLARDVRADRAAAQAEFLHAFLELLGGEIRVLQGHGGKGDEALRPGCAQLGELLVLDLDERSREIALGLVPVGIDAERLDVDALLVHRADAVLPHDQGLRLGLQTHERHRLGHGAVRMHVDGFHAAAAHHHFPAPDCPARLRLRVARGEEIAADEGDTGHGAGGIPDELSASGQCSSCPGHGPARIPASRIIMRP